MLWLFVVSSALGATYDGTCRVARNGRAAPSRNCRITWSKGQHASCPGDYHIIVSGFTIGSGETPSAMVALDDEHFTGSCRTEWRSTAASGSISGGNLQGTITIAYVQGSNVGQSYEIEFSGTAK